MSNSEVKSGLMMAQHNHRRGEPGGDARRRRILLVEDNPADADLIKEHLDTNPAGRTSIVHVDNLTDAKRTLELGSPDVVLLDLRLPDAAGVECVEAILASGHGVPIVVLTGIDDHELAIRCLAAGAQDYLSKHEVDSHALRRALGYAIARSSERQAVQRADAAQRRLAEIVEASSDAIISIDRDRHIQSWNFGASQIFGFTTDEAIGQLITDIVRIPPAPFASRWRVEEAACGNGGPPELVALTADGTPRVLSISTVWLNGGQPYGVAAILRDITERKTRDIELRTAVETLRRREQQLRALSARVNRIREKERTRVARTVHDELGQLLTALNMDLRWVERRLSGEPDALDPAAIVARIVESAELVHRAVETVQRLATELRPTVLDAVGLNAAIREEARRFSARAGLEVEVQIDTRPPQGDVATHLFRIVQELLTNIARHADAERVIIEASQDNEHWTLRIIDDGVGIPDDALDFSTLGLLGMSERALELGATFKLERGTGGGTIATIRLPLKSMRER